MPSLKTSTAILGVVLTACEPYWTPGPDPDDSGEPLEVGLLLVPDHLVFQTPVASGSETQSFRVINNTGSRVKVWNFTTVEGDQEVFEVAGATDIDLDPGDEFDVPVTFRPDRSDTWSGVIDIANSWAEAPLQVELTASGIAPKISVFSPSALAAPTFCTDTDVLTLRNAGLEKLDITELDLDGLERFEVALEVPDTLTPGETVEVPVRFTPVGGAGTRIQEFFEITSTDPAPSPTTVRLVGDVEDVPLAMESFRYDAGGGIEVLVVLDDEGSTTGFVSRAADGMRAFVDALVDRGIGFRITAVSTTTGCPGSSLAYGTPVDAPAAIAAALRAGLTDPTQGGYSDELLALAQVALANSEPGSCLEGWVDPVLPLHVIVISSRDDGSQDGWEAAVSGIRGAVSNVASISVIGGLTCQTYPTSYAAAANTTGGEVLDGCSGSWASHWTALAAYTAQLEAGPTGRTLAQPMVPASVSVTVEGEAWEAWTLAEQRVSLTAAPADGAHVVLSYRPEADCD